MDEAAREARRQYYRDYARKHKESIRASQKKMERRQPG